MSSRRTLILLAAIVVGIIAAFAIFNYVNSVEDRAEDEAQQVSVFVVKVDIAAGTPGERAIGQMLIDRDEVPQRFRPATAITDLEVIRGKVAVTALTAGEVVVEQDFGSPADQSITFARQIPPGQVAMSVSIDSVRAVGNLLIPGDKVNLIFQGAPDPNASTAGDASTYFFQSVEILAIGGTFAPGAGEQPVAPSSGLITFNVPPEAALQIAEATRRGLLYLTLVADEYEPIEIGPIDVTNMFPTTLTPYPDAG